MLTNKLSQKAARESRQQAELCAKYVHSQITPQNRVFRTWNKIPYLPTIYFSFISKWKILFNTKT